MPVTAPAILAALPQTQCTRCGYPDCAGYAQAIADGAAAINQCPPGGAEGIRRLAALTGRPVLALNPENGLETARSLAVIDEAWCIGCTLCLDACPTDAILGSNKLMHTVIEAWCTGCELCLPVCPVDCIAMEPVTGDLTGWAAWSPAQAEDARQRYAFRGERLQREQAQGLRKRADDLDASPADAELPAPAASDADARKRATIAAALARARQQREPGKG